MLVYRLLVVAAASGPIVRHIDFKKWVQRVAAINLEIYFYCFLWNAGIVLLERLQQPFWPEEVWCTHDQRNESSEEDIIFVWVH